MAISEDKILCGECGNLIIDELSSDSVSQRKPCPKCGSLNRNFQVFHEETLTMRDLIKMKAKHKGEKKSFIETIIGFNKSKSLEKLVNLERTIDRENNLYFELITDYESGEVIHRCEEPLSEHVGHGSAKKKIACLDNIKILV